MLAKLLLQLDTDSMILISKGILSYPAQAEFEEFMGITRMYYYVTQQKCKQVREVGLKECVGSFFTKRDPPSILSKFVDHFEGGCGDWVGFAMLGVMY